jgi:nickel/cobalt transporter (NicO) family protein
MSSLEGAAIGANPRAPGSIFARVFCREPVPDFAEEASTTGWLAWVAALAALLAAAMLASGALDAALAQSAPFGVGGPRPPAPTPDGIIGWVLVKQAEFYRALSGALRAAKSDGSALFGLFGLSFAYGIFHAAGPGHGKAVISSYLVANKETWRRGIALSFASALLQALVAVLLVGIVAVLLGLTAQRMCAVDYVIEIVSYALIAAVGARLVWVKSRGLLRAFHGLSRPLSELGAAVTLADHGDHHHHDHDHGGGCGHAYHRHHDDHEAAACGHVHGPVPEDLAGTGGWRRGLSAIVAVGLRPCSGAIVVLVFALAQGLFWAGVGATFLMGIGTAITVAVIATLTVSARTVAARLVGGRAGIGSLALRSLEVAASVLILAFGLILLAGYMVSERIMFC